MTFSDWYSSLYVWDQPHFTDIPNPYSREGKKSRVVYIEPHNPGFVELWNISDYKVTTFGGSVAWLIKVE